VLGRDFIPAYAVVAMLGFGIACVAVYVRHAFAIENPILDLRLLRIPSFNAGVAGGSLYRVGVGAIPFLMPLMFQLGFGLTAFQSGMLSCSAALGSIGMKFSASFLLRRFGFRPLLIFNGLLSCGFMACYGLLGAMTPFGLVSLLLLVGGFLRSLQFTAMNALSYADIDRRAASTATTLYSVAQQLSLSAGVAVAAFILEAIQWQRGEQTIVAGDFSNAFFAVAAIAALSSLQFLRLKTDAGSSVLAHTVPKGHADVTENRSEI
jgi:hypothetical protein